MDFPCFLHIVINARNLLNFILFKEQLMDKGHLDTTITSWCSQVKASFFYFSFSLCFSPACVLLHLMCGFVTGEVATILEAKLKPDRNLRSRSSLGCTSSFPRSRQEREGGCTEKGGVGTFRIRWHSRTFGIRKEQGKCTVAKVFATVSK